MCCVSFDRCVMCVILCVVSYCSTTATGCENPFAVKIYNNNNNNISSTGITTTHRIIYYETEDTTCKRPSRDSVVCIPTGYGLDD
jgi:hypothetical protein